MTKRIGEVTVYPVKPKYGLIAFASLVLYGEIYLSSVAVYTRPYGGIRLVYPRKKNLDVCHPITNELGQAIESAVSDEVERLGLL